MERKALFSAGAVIVLACCMTTGAGAQNTFDRRTYFTFSGPVEVPGVTLPAGKYLFRHPASDRSVVQVSSADAKTVYGMFFSIPAERVTPASEPEIRFMETAAGVPPAVKTWWQPGDRIGREFIYPREQAKRLAKVTNEPVLTTKTEAANVKRTTTRDLSRISPTGTDNDVKDEKPSGASGLLSKGELAQSQAPTPGATPDKVTESNTSRSQLPATASLTPMAGLTGAIAIFGACALWVRRRAF